MWNSVESLTSVIAAANWGIVVALLAAFGLSVLTLVTGGRRDTLLRIADRAQQERIADAGRLAAEATERSTRLEAAAEQTRLEQEKLRTENLELQARVERERIARLKLEEWISPRSLRATPRKVLVALLGEGQGKTVSLRALNSTPESSTYAEEIRGAFVQAGWQATPVLYATVRETEELSGVTIVLQSVPTATSLTVRKAFGEAGIPVTYRSDDRLASDQILVVIGKKPTL